MKSIQSLSIVLGHSRNEIMICVQKLVEKGNKAFLDFGNYVLTNLKEFKFCTYIRWFKGQGLANLVMSTFMQFRSFTHPF